MVEIGSVNEAEDGDEGEVKELNQEKPRPGACGAAAEEDDDEMVRNGSMEMDLSAIGVDDVIDVDDKKAEASGVRSSNDRNG